MQVAAKCLAVRGRCEYHFCGAARAPAATNKTGDKPMRWTVRTPLRAWALCASLPVLLPAALQARVTRIVVDDVKPLAAAAGQTIAYEQISGRAFGELNPALAQNALVNDIHLGKDADGKLRYTASFVLTKPVDMAQASGLLWHDVPNRGTPLVINVLERNFGDVGLASAWQGDNVGGTAVRPTMRVGDRHFLVVPVAKNADGSAVTGPVLARIVNRSGPASQGLFVQANPLPYRPETLDTAQATLVSRDGESTTGVVTHEVTIASSDWAWAACSTTNPFPGTPDPTQICLKNGFDASKLYQLVFRAKDPYVLGAGFAAWRDVGQFFKTATADDAGTANPVAGRLTHSIARGVSQSGNFLRGWLHLGFNQGENGAMVHDGLWPIIAGRRIALNFRWAQPDGVLELYQAGSEGPQWWAKWPDTVRGLPEAGILDRCTASKTCPKVVEHFGSAEVWALKMTTEWVGTAADADIPVPANVRRYYIASSTHGGGAGGFNSSLSPTLAPGCPGNNFGTGVLPANPLPHTETVNAIRARFRDWVMRGTPPPDSVWPRLARGELVDANKTAMGFPTLPGLRPTIPETDFIMPVLDYDWGLLFNPTDASGVPTNVPPPIRQVIRMRVPRVDADGNEVGGVPVVLADAPLGTYLGWNVTAGGTRPFHQGQICNYVGGMIPFAKTQAERLASGDPRLSLEERYGTHEAYVRAVKSAAARALRAGFLLPADAEALVQQAAASDVLR
jgi:Alpha/beta hydrolase domain